MKTIKNLLCVAIMAASCSMGHAQNIYSNFFNGGSGSIVGTAPTEANSYIGGTNTARWISTFTNGVDDTVLANGEITTNGGCALLPFKPQSGAIYYMTASLTVPAPMATWVSMGFSQSAIPTNSPGHARFTDDPHGYGWIDPRANVASQLFAGAGSGGGGPSVNAMLEAGTYTLEILLNTFGTNGGMSTRTNWTVSAFVNGVIAGTNVVGGTQLGTNIIYGAGPPIGFAGLGQNTFGSGSVAGVQWNYWALSTPLIPVIFQSPASADVNQGGGFTNTISALADTNGKALFYQWYYNASSNYAGATVLSNSLDGRISGTTTASLNITNIQSGDAGYYYVVVTNTYGAVTSALSSLSVFARPTFSAQFPVTYTNSFTLYSGAAPQFSVSAVGKQPIYYQWYTNGTVCAGQTNSAFTWANLPLGAITSYCIATNSVGGTTSMVWNASVIAAPDAPFPLTVLSLHPLGYWRLNEPEIGNGDAGLIASDYGGGNNGIYTNVYLGNLGYSPDTDPSDTSPLLGSVATTDNDAFDIQGIDFAAPVNANATFSVEAWVNGINQTFNGAGIVAKGYSGAEQFVLDIYNNEYRFQVRDAAGNLYGPSVAIGPNGSWQHLVGVCDEVNGVVSLYINGVLAGSASIPSGSGLYSTSIPMTIGARSSTSTSGNDLQFRGYLNDVAVFNYALSVDQVMAQYCAVGPILPYFTQTPPSSIAVNGGGSLNLPAMAFGCAPFGYSWTINSTTVASGVGSESPLNAALAVANVPAGWNGGQLQLTVTNAYGSTNLSVALTVYDSLMITNNLPAQITLLSGASYTYSIGALGRLPYSYQWYQAGAPISNATNSTYTATAGAPGSTTYYVVITNTPGAVTSLVSTLTSVAQPTNAYSAGIFQLNPAGYWPMHEVEAAAPGDIETNYGTLGLLGTAYYPDWLGDGAGITRQVPGAIVGDSDTALHFNHNVGTLGNGAGTWTNEIYIPHTSPLATLNPPFSVECWFYPTNTGSGALSQSVWGQHGFEALNAGYAGSGNGAYKGIQLGYSSGGFIIYGYYSAGQNAIASYTSAPINNWYHVVVACDADTNFTLYVNGAAVASGAGFGKYAPDYWTPLAIGGTRGGTRSSCGTIDEFAVYTNAIDDVNTHYTDGVSGGAGAYVHDVTNDHPVIYLRMDAPAYTAPNIGTWPVLVNYGSAGNPGVYSPGTYPGIVNGLSIGGTNCVGLSSSNVAALSGVSSYADVGYASAYDPTGSSATFTVTAMFHGDPCDNRVQSIVSHGSNSWQLNVSTNGAVVFNAGNGQGGGSGTGQNSGDLSTVGVYNDGNWHQVVAVVSSNVVSLYVDGVLDNSGTPTGVTAGSVIPGNPGDVLIGADPSYADNPVGVGRQFAGQVCEVAFFNQALTAMQAQQLYSLAFVNGSVVNLSPTNILVARAGSQLTLSWAVDHTGWTLQSQTNSLTGSWVDVSGSSSTNAVTVSINPLNGSVFYRLIYRP